MRGRERITETGMGKVGDEEKRWRREKQRERRGRGRGRTRGKI